MVSRPKLLDLARERVVFFDGACGTSLQKMNLSPDDFGGYEGLNEILVRTRPEKIIEMHGRFLAAGCHVVETNSFGALKPVLEEYSLGDKAYELNRLAARAAREAASAFDRPERPRYVAGSVGPTTKLPTLRHIGFDELTAAYREQIAGLVDGGVDMLVVETCQDLLQIRAALYAIRREFVRFGRALPLMVTVTIEPTGTMLLGSDLAAALSVIAPLKPDIFGINCATGPAEMKRHVQFLSGASPLPIVVQPNAGLPENIDGRTVYPLSPEEFALWHEGFILEDGIRFAGGCCGTTHEHLAALVTRADRLVPKSRTVSLEPALASLYQSMPLKQEPRPFLVGERANASGSRKFRDFLLASDYDGMVSVAREQEERGAHAIDLNVAYAGRNENEDMAEAVARFVHQVRLPLVLDTTSPQAMEAALKLNPGRALLNSINLEDGEGKARAVLALARDFGAAVVALTIDEEGMARTLEHKLRVAERLYRMATREFRLEPSDLVFDLLTFTVASGDEGMRDSAATTLAAIRELKHRLSGVLTVLGVSNVSYGLKPGARQVLTSVFLHLAIEAGLDLAIVDAGKILPLARIEPGLIELARDLLLNRRPEALADYIRHFEEHGDSLGATDDDADELPLAQRIGQKILRGENRDLELLLGAALTRRRPLELVNEILIPAMKEVGELFGAGRMQLPFVLQSAEVMKQAVRFLEPMMTSGESSVRGKIVLATVKGDVHDIGKNLVDILLSNNGYKVFNLGVKISVEDMIEACRREGADILGMSGLLVKSTLVMKENLEELKRRGLQPTVLLGGAALTRRFVDEDLRAVYGPDVHYGKDAFEALSLLGQKEEVVPESATIRTKEAGENRWTLSDATKHVTPPVDKMAAIQVVPKLGSQLVELSLENVWQRLDEDALFIARWQYRKGKLSEDEFTRILNDEARPALTRCKESLIAAGALRPRAVLGQWPCRAQGNAVVVFDENKKDELASFLFPRERTNPGRCLADYFLSSDGWSVFAAFVVTVGDQATLFAQSLFESHRYRDYLHAHGLCVETAEAAAQLTHERLRAQLSPMPQAAFTRRYSFGYPSCPSLENQNALLTLLDAQRLGVTLSEGLQMVPEQSVSAFLAPHPGAVHFDPLR